MVDARPDPRVYFAAERTLLAWLRTGIGIMAFGFVVARLGLFVRLFEARAAGANVPSLSAYLGVLLVLVGVGASAVGTRQYARFCRSLRPEELPSPRVQIPGLTLGWSLVAVGSILVVLLLS